MLFHVKLKDFSRGHNKEGIYWKIGAWGAGTQTMSGIVSPGLSHFHHLTLKDLNQKKGKWSQFIIARDCNHPKSFSFSAKYTQESYYNNCTCSIMKTGIRCCKGATGHHRLSSFHAWTALPFCVGCLKIVIKLLFEIFVSLWAVLVPKLPPPSGSDQGWFYEGLVWMKTKHLFPPPLPPSPHFPSTTHLKSFLHFCRDKILSFERSNKQNESGEGCKIVYSQLSQHGRLK